MNSPSIHDSQDIPPKPSRRPSYNSDCSDDEDGKDNQARASIAKPVSQKPQPSTSSGTHTNEILRKSNTYPKALTFGRGNMAPLANDFTMECRHRCGYRLNINHPLSQEHQGLLWYLLTGIVTIDRVQTYN